MKLTELGIDCSLLCSDQLRVRRHLVQTAFLKEMALSKVVENLRTVNRKTAQRNQYGIWATVYTAEESWFDCWQGK
jgi:hypothetical protein